MSTIIIGVDASERSEDAIAFGRRLAAASTAHVIVANAYPYSDMPSRASNAGYRDALREDALAMVREMRDKLEGVPEERSQIRIAADTSPPRALHRGKEDPGPADGTAPGRGRGHVHLEQTPRRAKTCAVYFAFLS